MNPTEHPAGIRLLVRGESACGVADAVELTVLEWSGGAAAKVRYNVTNHIAWLHDYQAHAVKVLEVLEPAPTHPPHPYDEMVHAAWRLRAECRFVGKCGTYEDGTRLLTVVGVGPAAESLARILDAATSLDPRSTSENTPSYLAMLLAQPNPYPKT